MLITSDLNLFNVKVISFINKTMTFIIFISYFCKKIFMVINTKEKATRIKLLTMLTVIIYLLVLVASLYLKWSPNHILELSMTVIFFLIMIFIFTKKYTYLYYNTDGPKIILRFIPLQPLTAGNFSVEISKRDFAKYEIQDKAFGLRKELTLFARTSKGIGKYKSVSLSILNKEELELLLKDMELLRTK